MVVVKVVKASERGQPLYKIKDKIVAPNVSIAQKFHCIYTLGVEG